MAKVWGVWCGGASYAVGDPEAFGSFAEAKRVFAARAGGWDPVTGLCCSCVSESEMLIYGADPAGMEDPYPSCILQDGARGGVAVVQC